MHVHGEGREGGTQCSQVSPPLLLTRLRGAVFGCCASWLVRASEVNCSDSSWALLSALQGGWHYTGRRWHPWSQAPTHTILPLVCRGWDRLQTRQQPPLRGFWASVRKHSRQAAWLLPQHGCCHSLAGRGQRSSGTALVPAWRDTLQATPQLHCSLPTSPVALGSPEWGPHASSPGSTEASGALPPPRPRGLTAPTPCPAPTPARHPTPDPQGIDPLHGTLSPPIPKTPQGCPH